MNQEQELREIRNRWDVDDFVIDDKGQSDILTLLEAIDQRDAIIHDLQLDGSALARRAVEEFIAKAIEWATKSREKYRHLSESVPMAMGATIAWLREQQSGSAPQDPPLPPDQVRQECERLRQQIDELLSGCGSHSCKVQRPHGQGVSGPCRCVEKLRAARGEEYTP